MKKMTLIFYFFSISLDGAAYDYPLALQNLPMLVDYAIPQDLINIIIKYYGGVPANITHFAMHMEWNNDTLMRDYIHPLNPSSFSIRYTPISTTSKLKYIFNQKNVIFPYERLQFQDFAYTLDEERYDSLCIIKNNILSHKANTVLVKHLNHFSLQKSKNDDYNTTEIFCEDHNCFIKLCSSGTILIVHYFEDGRIYNIQVLNDIKNMVSFHTLYAVFLSQTELTLELRKNNSYQSFFIMKKFPFCSHTKKDYLYELTCTANTTGTLICSCFENHSNYSPYLIFDKTSISNHLYKQLRLQYALITAFVSLFYAFLIILLYNQRTNVLIIYKNLLSIYKKIFIRLFFRQVNFNNDRET